MRDKIIQYLQDIKCEWFPVEWDAFMYNFMGIVLTYNESDLKNIRIKYEFFDNYYIVLFGDRHNVQEFHTTCNYFTLDRCKLLLLNAVRSIDEPKRKASGEKIERYAVYSGNMVFVYYLDGGYLDGGSDIVWENGEFK